MDTVSAAITLFLIMDPIGNLPVCMSLLRGESPARRRRIIMRELLLAYGVLLLFLFAGQAFMDLFALTSEAITVAGGIILFIIAIRMIFPPAIGGIMGESGDEGIFLVPLAVPLIAGPSTLATLMLLARQDPGRLGDWFLAMTAAWVGTVAILLAGGPIYRLLRERGLMALERLMGMILVAIAVQMLLEGVAAFLAGMEPATTGTMHGS
jgi:multiple antibiotic resistance protein